MYQQYLPVSNEQMTEINNYFSLLEKAIDNKEDVRREEFPPIDPTVDGFREYKYHSSAKFKELASQHQQLNDRQSLDVLPGISEKVSTTPSESSNIQNMERFSISSQTDATILDSKQRFEDDKHFSGELESKCIGKLSNE